VDVTERHDPRRLPFAVAAAALLIASTAVVRLPQSFGADMQRNGVLTGDPANLAFVILAVVAGAQAAYGGFVLLRPERLETELANGRLPGSRAASIAWMAAGLASLTLVYGVAAFSLTGLRGGFWVFVIMELAQGAWYFRQVRVAGDRLTATSGAVRP
jgi:hypothetical protein